jgi:hypothetical protein
MSPESGSVRSRKWRSPQFRSSRAATSTRRSSSTHGSGSSCEVPRSRSTATSSLGAALSSFTFGTHPDIDPLTTDASCYIRVDSADALHREWEGVGIQSDRATGSRLMPPVDTDYGIREFALGDKSGKLVRVGNARPPTRPAQTRWRRSVACASVLSLEQACQPGATTLLRASSTHERLLVRWAVRTDQLPRGVRSVRGGGLVFQSVATLGGSIGRCFIS